MRFGRSRLPRQRVPVQNTDASSPITHVPPRAPQIPCPPVFVLRRRARVHRQIALQSYSALGLVLLLIMLRRMTVRTANRAIDRQQIRMFPTDRTSTGSSKLSLHIFAAPKPFVETDRENQLRALESWLALTPTPVITLLGDAAGTRHVSRIYRVHHDSRIDTSFLGVPLFPSILAATNHSRADVTILINADIVLFDDTVVALYKLQTTVPQPWLALAARWDIDALPNSVVRGPRTRLPENVRRAAAAHVRRSGSLHTFGGIDFWAWKTALAPLQNKYIPPFLFGRGRYDNWFSHEVIAAHKHAVIDISEAITAAHVRHDHHLISGFEWQSTGTDTNSKPNAEFWAAHIRHSFEAAINAYLAANYGTYTPQHGTVLHAPLKLSSCFEAFPLCLFERTRPHACRCEHSPYVRRAHNDPYIVSGSNLVFCGLLPTNAGSAEVDKRSRWALSGREEPNDSNSVFGLPLSQQDVLETVGNRTASDVIVLVVADFSDRELVMETVCSMRTSRIFHWLVIAALDDDMYRFCVSHGLAVYLADYDDSSFSDHSSFRQLARLQSIIEILQRQIAVLSLIPGTIFHNSPWSYVSAEAANADVAFLPSLPIANRSHGGISSTSSASAAVFLARPTELTLTFVKQVMALMENSGAYDGKVMWEVACGVNGEGVLKQGECQLGKGLRAHLFDIDLFHPIESNACPACSASEQPIVSFPSTSATTFDPKTVIAAIIQAGLSHTKSYGTYCVW